MPADAAGGFTRSRELPAERELLRRIGHPDHGHGRDAGLALEPDEPSAQHLEVLRRVGHDSRRPVVDEGAVPARAHERCRLAPAELLRVGDRRSGQGCVVDTDNSEPVVVIRALRAIGRHLRAESGAEGERRLQPVVVDPHERMPEPVDAAVAPVAGRLVRADRRRLARLPRIDRRRHARDEPVREARTAAGIVAPRQVVLQVGERRILLERVGPPDRVHDAVAAREQKAALPPDGPLDRRDRRPGVVPVAHDRLEAADPAVLHVVAQEAAAFAEVDCDWPFRTLAAPAKGKQPDRYGYRDEPREREQDQTSGPPWWRAARWIVVLSYG